MGLETPLMCFTTIITIVFTILYAFFKYRFNTWKKQNIPYVTPKFPFGNSNNFVLQRESMGDNYKNMYDDLKKKNSTFGGIFTFSKPQLLLIDPELIKSVLTKDFRYFVDRGVYLDETNDPLSAHLVFLSGQRWKNSRAKITPTFTSGKMKMMFHTMLETSKGLGTILDRHKNKAIDIKEIFAKQSTAIIASCAFGIECNSLKDPDNEFQQNGKKIFEFGVRDAIFHVLATNFPIILKWFKMTQVRTDVSRFFLNVLKETVTYREKNNVQRKDFLDLMIKLKNKQSILDEVMDTPKEKEEGITFLELAAHSFVFFVAGFETTSSTLNFCIFELSNNQAIQDKVRKEVLDFIEKHDGAVTYEGIMEMKYMDKIFQEILRKYPPVPVMQRQCKEEYKVPNSNFTIKKGTDIIISTLGLHRDSEYYPDPDKFDPERFSDEEKSRRHPYAHIPFGEGPRSCIGMRFAMQQMKIVLSVLLKDFKFELDQKTITPVVFDPRASTLSPKDKFWIQAERISI